MIMKLSTINQVARILSGMKINKITDKETKSAILKDYLAIRKVSKETENETSEIAKKFQEDWMEEMVQVKALRDKEMPIEGHDDYLKAEADANQLIADILAKEVEIELVKASAEPLYNLDVWGEDNTLGQIANTVDYLVENGIAE